MVDSDAVVPDAMTISQLSARAGVPARRIRYYVSEQLLPGPHGKGRASYYTARHLDRLQQISALREVNLSLEEIRNRLGSDDHEGAERSSEAAEPVTWNRYEIVPGVEMHVRQDLDRATRETARSMVDAVRNVLQQSSSIEQERNSAPE